MKSSKIQKQVDNLLTVKDLQLLFRVSVQTIHVWRNQKQLPCIIIEGDQRPAVRFVESDVREWARKQQIKMRAA